MRYAEKNAMSNIAKIAICLVANLVVAFLLYYFVDIPLKRRINDKLRKAYQI